MKIQKPQALLVKSKALFCGSGPAIPSGELLAENGKIIKTGQTLSAPAGTQVLDYTDKLVFPGLIDAGSRIGINKEPFNYLTETRDGADPSDPIQPTLLAEDAFDPFSPALDAARAFGITACFVSCGPGNLIDGQGAVFKLKKAQDSSDMVIPGTRQMNFTVGDLPVRGYSQMHRPPQTRMAAANMLRSSLLAARKLIDNGQEDKADAKTAALIPILKREEKARFYAHAAMDLAAAVRLGDEFSLDYLLEGGYEAWKMPDFWKKHPVSFILAALPFGPMQTLIKSWYDYSMESVPVLESSGCLSALTADDVTHTARLPMIAGFFSVRGLTRESALEAVTVRPAAILGLDARIGSLEEGKDADFTVWTDHALLSTSHCAANYIEGEPVYLAK